MSVPKSSYSTIDLAARASRVETLAWSACLVVLALWAAAYVSWPFSNDQGNLAWVGDVVRHGGMPYRDAWDVKGPVAHLLFAFVGAVFGRNEWGLRVFDLLALGAGATAVSLVVRRYSAAGGWRWAVAVYLLWYATLGHHDTAQPDGWAAVMVACAVALLLTSAARPAPLASAAAGALVGVCALIKPMYAAFLALPLLEAIGHRHTVSRARSIRCWGASLVGFAVPVVLCVTWFATRGALDEWMDVHLRWIPSTYTQMDAAWLSRIKSGVAQFTTAWFAPAIALAAGGVRVVRRSRAGRDAWLLVAWVGIAALVVLIQGQFYAYHWLPVYPALATLTGLGVDRALTAWRERGRRGISVTDGTPMVIALAGVVIVLVGAALGPAARVYHWAKAETGLGGATFGENEFGAFASHGSFAELMDYLRAHSGAHDAVVVWGSNAGINYLTGRPSPTRFGFVQPLVEEPDTELRRQYRDEFMRRLEAAAPLYVVSLNERACAAHPTTEQRKALGQTEGLMHCLAAVPAVHAYVLDHYVIERMIGPLEVRRRR